MRAPRAFFLSTAVLIAGCSVGEPLDEYTSGHSDAGAAHETSTKPAADADLSTAMETGADGGSTVEDTAIDSGSAIDTGSAAVDSSAVDTGTAVDTGEMDSGHDTGKADTGTVSSDSGCVLHGFSGTLASFTFDGQPGDETSVAPATTATGLTVSPITRSSALVPNAGTGSMNAKGWTSGTDAYYTFIVTPPAGCTIAPDTLAGALQASSTGPTSAHAGTTANGFAASSSANLASFSTSLSGASNAPLEVRLYGTGASSATGTMRVTSLTLTGSID